MGWIHWVAAWFVSVPPLSHKTKEALITILDKRPLEFRVAFLNYQIRNLITHKI